MPKQIFTDAERGRPPRIDPSGPLVPFTMRIRATTRDALRAAGNERVRHLLYTFAGRPDCMRDKLLHRREICEDYAGSGKCRGDVVCQHSSAY